MPLREVIESRVLGAVKFLDNPTQAVVTRLLNVSANDTSFIRNRSHHYVINNAPGLADHTTSFMAPPATPPLGSVAVHITVSDPVKRYLPRIVTVNLPRDPDPEHSDQADSLFRAVEVQLYSAPTFALHPNWSGIRASITQAGTDGTSVGGALLRVIRASDDVVLARGYSDPRGEALVVIPGIPITNFATDEPSEEDADASGPVVIAETAVRVEAIVDDSLPWPVNPDVLEANRASWLRDTGGPILLTLRTGQIQFINIEVDLS